MLESNGRCGGLGTAPQNTGQGPGNGEYYFKDFYSPYHDEVAIAGLAQIPGYPDMVTTVFDPIACSTAAPSTAACGGSAMPPAISPKLIAPTTGTLATALLRQGQWPGRSGADLRGRPHRDRQLCSGSTPTRTGCRTPVSSPSPASPCACTRRTAPCWPRPSPTPTAGVYFSSAPRHQHLQRAFAGISSLSPNTANFTCHLDNALDYAAGSRSTARPTLLEGRRPRQRRHSDSDGAVVGGLRAPHSTPAAPATITTRMILALPPTPPPRNWSRSGLTACLTAP